MKCRYILLVLLAACQPAVVEPPDPSSMPEGTWMYVKGESRVWCDREDPYYYDTTGSTLMTAPTVVGGEDVETIQDHRLSDFGCEQDYSFYDQSNATSSPGPCGPKVWVLSSWLQLVSPGVLYLDRYYEVTDPYDQNYYGTRDETLRCRISETGYLQPLVDVLDLSGLDL